VKESQLGKRAFGYILDSILAKRAIILFYLSYIPSTVCLSLKIKFVIVVVLDCGVSSVI